jgi:pimeloyl-ACP methyl ester carboxylesterase
MKRHNGAACCSALLAMTIVATAYAAPPQIIRVGTLNLTYCNSDYDGYCGAIERPIDPSGRVPGTVGIGFEFYPHTAGNKKSLGTILPQEGGPGYSSTGSRDFYLGLFAPLRDRRDVLIIDKRGTGLSGAIDCARLQNLDPDLLGSVDACAKQLGTSAYYYGTAFAVGDLAAVLDALGISRVDFYGDSYGTFVGQVFAGLEPSRLRSIILDSAYPVRAPDTWFATDWATAWASIDLTCSRSPSCRSVPGRASDRVTSLIQYVRQTPITGTAPDGAGNPQSTTIDPGTLLYTIDSAGYGPTIYRDLDAAVRAWAANGDAAPLLRLVAEANTGSLDDPADFSYGLYTAVICSDYPLLYNLTASRAVRQRQYQSALADARVNRPNLFAPFTLDEGIASQAYITPLDTCLPWPKPPSGIVQGAPLPLTTEFPALPTLVLSGDIDSVTSATDAAEAAAQFPDAVHIVLPNLTHVVADTDEIGCAAGIVVNFIANLSPGDASCGALIRPIRTVPAFARQSSSLSPLTPSNGNHASSRELQLGAAVLETIGDAIARWYVNYSGTDSGLRGGSFSYVSTANGYKFTLTDDQWTEDVTVNGTVKWNKSSSQITADVSFASRDGSTGHVHATWTDSAINAVASVNGIANGHALHATRIAP